MTFLYNTGDWFNLGHGNEFRKFDFYNIEWLQGVNLENMLVVGGPYGMLNYILLNIMNENQ